MLQLLGKFQADFEGAGDSSDLAWFPAWVLTERPALAAHLRVLIELLGLERQGRQRDVVERRRTLRGLDAPLYTAYMATR